MPRAAASGARPRHGPPDFPRYLRSAPARSAGRTAHRARSAGGRSAAKREDCNPAPTAATSAQAGVTRPDAEQVPGAPTLGRSRSGCEPDGAGRGRSPHRQVDHGDAGAVGGARLRVIPRSASMLVRCTVPTACWPTSSAWVRRATAHRGIDRRAASVPHRAVTPPTAEQAEPGEQGPPRIVEEEQPRLGSSWSPCSASAGRRPDTTPRLTVAAPSRTQSPSRPVPRDRSWGEKSPRRRALVATSQAQTMKPPAVPQRREAGEWPDLGSVLCPGRRRSAQLDSRRCRLDGGFQDARLLPPEWTRWSLSPVVAVIALTGASDAHPVPPACHRGPEQGGCSGAEEDEQQEPARDAQDELGAAPTRCRSRGP